MPVPVRFKVAMAGLLCRPGVGALIARLFSDRIPVGGLRLDTHSPEITPGTKAQLFWRLYERAELRMVARYFPRDLDVVELGASIGMISIHLARRLGAGRRMVSVEANPALTRLVEANVREHAPHARLEVVGAAIDYPSDGRREARFHVATRNVDSRLSTAPGARTVPVPTITLSGLLDRHGLERFALVSDIEGAEAAILFEDPAALGGCEWLLIELHQTMHRGRSVSVDDMVTRLGELGFALVARRGPVVVAQRRK
ncbi:MAG: FkbM family methyltransferase [Anaeromyxobacter sp.]